MRADGRLRALRVRQAGALACALAVLAGCGRGGADAPAAPAAAARAGQTDWGAPGEPAAARRTIRVSLSDEPRCSPAIVEVGHDETVRFELRNTGRRPHEVVIGVGQAAPWQARVAPGEAATLVWNFSRAGEFGFACRVPAQGGPAMAGRIRVVEPASHRH